MKLAELIDKLPLRVTHGDADTLITDLFDDSRFVTPGSLFVCRSAVGGDHDAYINAAIEAGAAAVLAISESCERAASGPSNVAFICPIDDTPIDQALAGTLAERLHGHPSRALKLIGITGTNGKSTTAIIAQHLLNSRGVRCGLIGTIFVDDGAQRHTASLTTPGAIDFSKHLAAMVANGCEAAVAEMSSHGLHQGRTAALDINVGIFTNLSGDHQDYHGEDEAYVDAKATLFEQLDDSAWAVMNDSDANTPRMLRDCPARVLRCSLSDTASTEHASEEAAVTDLEELREYLCRATISQLGSRVSAAQFSGPWGGVTAGLPLIGKFNVMNALQAVAATHVIKPFDRKSLRESIQSCPPVPGRVERVHVNPDSEPTVLVDYAHTDDALRNVLRGVRDVMTEADGKLIVVFGAGGDRDKGKRPRMAEAACEEADRVIITSDNPRGEEPSAIIDDILKGVPSQTASSSDQGTTRIVEVSVEADRSAAIRLAIHEAEANDIIVIAGKGHEDYQEVRGVRHHFDDREEARAALEQRQA